jgi:hypothetical protein
METEPKEYLFKWQNNRPDKFFFDYERSVRNKAQQYVLRFALILQLIHSTVADQKKQGSIYQRSYSII